MNNRQITNHIAQRLREKGVEVDVQPAITTNSFYLSFDGGLLKKARVGDHKGKGYHYTYEIGKHVKPPYEVVLSYEGRKYTRYRYTDVQAEDLITQVLIMRSNLRARYGKENYETYKATALAKESRSRARKASRPARTPRTRKPAGEVRPWYEYKTPLEYREAVEASPEYAAQQVRDAEDARRTNEQMMDAMGPDFDPNGFSTY